MSREPIQIMGECWREAKPLSDEELMAKISEARKAFEASPAVWRRFLFWEWQAKWSSEKNDLFHRWFYLKDALQLRLADRRLGITEKDRVLMSREKWLRYLSRARALDVGLDQ